MTEKFGLIILDGWGLGAKDKTDAVFQAKTPVMDNLMASYPMTTLNTFGEVVGLPEGQMGNSEVGHLNIGAGRVVYQELTRINKSIKDGDFFTHPMLIEAFEKAQNTSGKIHFIGLASRGGVHSSLDHLFALCKMAKNYKVEVFIHAFTDGRDCDPKSGLQFIQELESLIDNTNAHISTLTGRYYGMDRDNRWERINEAYQAIVNSKGRSCSTAKEAVITSYENDLTDEFLPATVITTKSKRNQFIEDKDTVINFNFRTDRPRQITKALTQEDLPEFGMKKLDLNYYCMTQYDESFTNVEVVFQKDNLSNTLGEVLSKMGKTQVRIAETEKYPHVTFFFNGGRETPFKGETRLLVNSPKVATYDLQPEMSAPEVKDEIITSIQKDTPDFICLNFANPDMVGHTGDFNAIVKAVETVDACLGEIIAEGQLKGYEFLVIADHGNADLAINKDGSPNTAHSLNPVPAIWVTSKGGMELKAGKLADVAPTILNCMSLAAPIEMDGETLLKSQIPLT